MESCVGSVSVDLEKPLTSRLCLVKLKRVIFHARSDSIEWRRGLAEFIRQEDGRGWLPQEAGPGSRAALFNPSEPNSAGSRAGRPHHYQLKGGLLMRLSRLGPDLRRTGFRRPAPHGRRLPPCQSVPLLLLLLL